MHSRANERIHHTQNSLSISRDERELPLDICGPVRTFVANVSGPTRSRLMITAY